MTAFETAQKVWGHIEPHLLEQGYELIEVEYAQQSGQWALRVFIDQPEGITLDDCQAASQLLSPILDEAELVKGSYVLEVSSPGFDRPVRRPQDFEKYAGQRVKLKTVAPVSGRKRFTGVLKEFRDGLIVIECDGTPYNIHIDNLHKANLDR